MDELKLSQLIRTAFPVTPLPGKFWRENTNPSCDIPGELFARVVRRPWTEITMNDWAMTGASAPVARAFLDANAFRYYLPSVLIGCLADIDYMNWALECLLPANMRRKTTGDWWQTFYAGFSKEQRVAVKQYLTFVSALPVGSANQGYIEEALPIWND